MVRSYCGKRYGVAEYGTGFLLGAVPGYLAASIIYGLLFMEIAASVVSGILGMKLYIGYLINRRHKEFTLEFCDYLDAVSNSLSCGKNAYEAFVTANEDMQDLYSKDSPVCVESLRVANGLKSGRSIDELLASMAARSKSEDVKIFADVFSICNTAGGNLKQTVNDTKLTITEKINIENEIRTSLAAPKNELNIMAIMPVAITAALRILGDSIVGETSFIVNTIAVSLFVVSYSIGLKIVKIEV